MKITDQQKKEMEEHQQIVLRRSQAYLMIESIAKDPTAPRNRKCRSELTMLRDLINRYLESVGVNTET